MDWASWFLLIIGVIYLLFNIKKVYHFFVGSFFVEGIAFTLWIVWFVLIWIMVLILAFFAPQYGKIAQWTFIWSIVGFFVYRNTIGFKDD